MLRASAPIRAVDVGAYTVPTATPESDGTLAWKATTLVVVHVDAAGVHGMGYTYADKATAVLVRDKLRDIPVACLMSPVRDAVPVYGSGGFTSYRAEELAKQLSDWSDDLQGLRLVRDRAPAGMDVSAGEYGYDGTYFRAMLQAGAVDVLQADATRCTGLTGFMRTAALCEAFHVPLSSHCAPSLHVKA